MLKKPPTSPRHILASKMFPRDKVMPFPYTSCCCNKMLCVIDVMSSCCDHCLEKTLKYSFVVTQGNCKQS